MVPAFDSTTFELIDDRNTHVSRGGREGRSKFYYVPTITDT